MKCTYAAFISLNFPKKSLTLLFWSRLANQRQLVCPKYLARKMRVTTALATTICTSHTLNKNLLTLGRGRQREIDRKNYCELGRYAYSALKPCVVTSTASNQLSMVRELDDPGLIMWVGDSDSADIGLMASAIENVANSAVVWGHRIATKCPFDLLGAQRIS